MAIDRVPTGIAGFDDLVQGGFPKGSRVLVTGTPGTGKTTFGMQFLYNGITKHNERGMYVYIGAQNDAILEQASMFGWNMKKLNNENKLHLFYIPVNELDQDISETILKKAQANKISRIVIDSISALSTNAPLFKSLGEMSVSDVMDRKSIFSPPVLGDYVIKRFIYMFIDDLKKTNCTTLLMSEASENRDFLSRDTISEFACDGVVVMNYLGIGDVSSRTLAVRKMRNTDHFKDNCPFSIGKSGIKVKKDESIKV